MCTDYILQLMHRYCQICNSGDHKLPCEGKKKNLCIGWKEIRMQMHLQKLWVEGMYFVRRHLTFTLEIGTYQACYILYIMRSMENNSSWWKLLVWSWLIGLWQWWYSNHFLVRGIALRESLMILMLIEGCEWILTLSCVAVCCNMVYDAISFLCSFYLL
jgi:hypothetical protein